MPAQRPESRTYEWATAALHLAAELLAVVFAVMVARQGGLPRATIPLPKLALWPIDSTADPLRPLDSAGLPIALSDTFLLDTLGGWALPASGGPYRWISLARQPDSLPPADSARIASDSIAMRTVDTSATRVMDSTAIATALADTAAPKISPQTSPQTSPQSARSSAYPDTPILAAVGPYVVYLFGRPSALQGQARPLGRYVIARPTGGLAQTLLPGMGSAPPQTEAPAAAFDPVANVLLVARPAEFGVLALQLSYGWNGPATAARAADTAPLHPKAAFRRVVRIRGSRQTSLRALFLPTGSAPVQLWAHRGTTLVRLLDIRDPIVLHVPKPGQLPEQAHAITLPRALAGVVPAPGAWLLGQETRRRASVHTSANLKALGRIELPTRYGMLMGNARAVLFLPQNAARLHVLQSRARPKIPANSPADTLPIRKFIVAGGDPDNTLLWQAHTLPAPAAWATPDPSGHYALVGLRNGPTLLIDLATGQLLAQLPPATHGQLWPVAGRGFASLHLVLSDGQSAKRYRVRRLPRG